MTGQVKSLNLIAWILLLILTFNTITDYINYSLSTIVHSFDQEIR